MSLFPTDRWTDDVEDVRGDMFFWARRRGSDGWEVGVGYWCKDGGWAGSTSGRTGEEYRATRFHPFPQPPHQ